MHNFIDTIMLEHAHLLAMREKYRSVLEQTAEYTDLRIAITGGTPSRYRILPLKGRSGQDDALASFRTFLKNHPELNGADGNSIPDAELLMGCYCGRNHTEMLSRISNRKYAERCVAELDRNIAAVEKMIRDYSTIDFERIREGLPVAYQEFCNPYLFAPRQDVTAWLKAQKAIKAANPPLNPERLVHRAANGEMMRSISETDVAQVLIDYGIPFMYERPQEFGDVIRYPDFTIPDFVEKRLKFIEFFGLMEKSDYEDKNRVKISDYLQAGYTVNRDVLFLFANKDGHIDMESNLFLILRFLGISC